ncbi:MULTISPECIES: hypothetical protein [Asaia]|nr:MULTISPECIES: hypothetical protein [Asaia]ETC97932.1 hypothetical protein P792_13270 [Asaia sp. SF2.1]
MSSAPIRKGWCPALHAPMQTHDGWLVRVTPDPTGLNPEQSAFLADYAARHGNERITLTLRGNLQLRGLDHQAALDFTSRAVAHGLGLAAPQQEARRRILFASPLAGLDPDCADDTLALAHEITHAMQDLPPSWHPPEKFSLAVDGGGLVPSGALRGDLALRHEAGAWILYEGALRHQPDRTDLVDEVLAALQRSAHRAVADRALHRAAPFRGTIPPLLGPFLPGCFGAVAVLGEISAQTLASIASAGAAIRLTPWRGLVLDRPVAAHDLITDPQDRRADLVACPGAGRCAQAHAPTQRDALSLVTELRGRRLHVSGCAKGCASHGIHDVTLVAGPKGYDLVWQGSVSDQPAESGLDIEDVRRRLRRA